MPVCPVRLMVTRIPSFWEAHHRSRPALFPRSWPGSLLRQDATCCLSQEPLCHLLHMGMFSSQQKVGETNAFHPWFTVCPMLRSQLIMKRDVTIRMNTNQCKYNVATVFLRRGKCGWSAPHRSNQLCLGCWVVMHGFLCNYVTVALQNLGHLPLFHKVNFENTHFKMCREYGKMLMKSASHFSITLKPTEY